MIYVTGPLAVVNIVHSSPVQKRVSRYGRCFMINSDTMGCPHQNSAGAFFEGQKQDDRHIFQG